MLSRTLFNAHRERGHDRIRLVIPHGNVVIDGEHDDRAVLSDQSLVTIGRPTAARWV
jgi:hypothetical protein